MATLQLQSPNGHATPYFREEKSGDKHLSENKICSFCGLFFSWIRSWFQYIQSRTRFSPKLNLYALSINAFARFICKYKYKLCALFEFPLHAINAIRTQQQHSYINASGEHVSRLLAITEQYYTSMQEAKQHIQFYQTVALAAIVINCTKLFKLEFSSR